MIPPAETTRVLTAQTVSLRPYHAADLEPVLALHAEVFGTVAAAAFRQRFAWSQVDNLSPESSPKWVLEAGGAIVGFVGTVPTPYRINGTRVVTHSSCDYMVKAAFQFHGIKLLREVFKHCAAVVSLDDAAATIAVSKFLKARSVGTMERHAKVLDVRLLARRFPALTKLPNILFWPSRVGLSLPDRLRSSFALRVHRHQGPFDARFERLFERCLAAENQGACLERDARYLNWRYGERSPHARCTVGVVGEGVIEGYVVCGVSSDAERTGFVLELVIAPDAEPPVADSLVAFALRVMRQQGAWVARWYVFESDAMSVHGLMRRWGFKRRAHRYELLVKLDGAIMPKPEHWHQQFGDAETSHGSLVF